MKQKTSARLTAPLLRVLALGCLIVTPLAGCSKSTQAVAPTWEPGALANASDTSAIALATALSELEPDGKRFSISDGIDMSQSVQRADATLSLDDQITYVLAQVGLQARHEQDVIYVEPKAVIAAQDDVAKIITAMPQAPVTARPSAPAAAPEQAEHEVAALENTIRARLHEETVMGQPVRHPRDRKPVMTEPVAVAARGDEKTIGDLIAADAPTQSSPPTHRLADGTLMNAPVVNRRDRAAVAHAPQLAATEPVPTPAVSPVLRTARLSNGTLMNAPVIGKGDRLPEPVALAEVKPAPAPVSEAVAPVELAQAESAVVAEPVATSAVVPESAPIVVEDSKPRRNWARKSAPQTVTDARSVAESVTPTQDSSPDVAVAAAEPASIEDLISARPLSDDAAPVQEKAKAIAAAAPIVMLVPTLKPVQSAQVVPETAPSPAPEVKSELASAPVELAPAGSSASAPVELAVAPESKPARRNWARASRTETPAAVSATETAALAEAGLVAPSDTVADQSKLAADVTTADAPAAGRPAILMNLPASKPTEIPPVVTAQASISDQAGTAVHSANADAALSAMAGADIHPEPSALKNSKNWVAKRGTTLRGTLKDWCDRAGVQLIWRSEFDYPLAATVDVEGDFEGAVRTLLSGFSAAAPQPYGRLHRQGGSGGSVLIVSSRGNDYGDN